MVEHNVILANQCLQKYLEQVTLAGEKTWDLVKVHLRVHAFDDILNKGATCNYNTKINESLCVPIKASFDAIGNGKNINEQVIKQYICCIVLNHSTRSCALISGHGLQN